MTNKQYVLKAVKSSNGCFWSVQLALKLILLKLAFLSPLKKCKYFFQQTNILYWWLKCRYNESGVSFITTSLLLSKFFYIYTPYSLPVSCSKRFLNSAHYQINYVIIWSDIINLLVNIFNMHINSCRCWYLPTTV